MRSPSAFRLLMVMLIAFGASATSVLAQPAGTKYLGCFKDDRWNRDLAAYTEDHPGMTAQACVDSCRKKGFKFAATQYGKHCFCGDSYGKFGPATNCDMKCAGNPAEICGGSAANCV